MLSRLRRWKQIARVAVVVLCLEGGNTPTYLYHASYPLLRRPSSPPPPQQRQQQRVPPFSLSNEIRSTLRIIQTHQTLLAPSCAARKEREGGGGGGLSLVWRELCFGSRDGNYMCVVHQSGNNKTAYTVIQAKTYTCKIRTEQKKLSSIARNLCCIESPSPRFLVMVIKSHRGPSAIFNSIRISKQFFALSAGSFDRTRKKVVTAKGGNDDATLPLFKKALPSRRGGKSHTHEFA